jgi:hypothetical protein
MLGMRAPFVGAFLVLQVFSTRAQEVTISDFNLLRPLNPEKVGGGGSWALDGSGNNVSQVRSFTDGTVSGQQVAPFQGGNPNSDGIALSDAFVSGVDLSALPSLALTARLLPGNTAQNILVHLWTDAGTRNLQSSYLFHASDFNSTEFRTVEVAFRDALNAGANLGSINEFAIGGDGVAGPESYQIQFTSLAAVPEPTTAVIWGLAGGLLVLFQARRNESKKLRAGW